MFVIFCFVLQALVDSSITAGSNNPNPNPTPDPNPKLGYLHWQDLEQRLCGAPNNPTNHALTLVQSCTYNSTVLMRIIIYSPQPTVVHVATSTILKSVQCNPTSYTYTPEVRHLQPYSPIQSYTYNPLLFVTRLRILNSIGAAYTHGLDGIMDGNGRVMHLTNFWDSQLWDPPNLGQSCSTK